MMSKGAPRMQRPRLEGAGWVRGRADSGERKAPKSMEGSERRRWR